MLVYATGGIAFAHVNAWSTDAAATTFFNDNTFLGSITSTNVSKKTATLTGWTGGGGIEWALMDALSVGLEYRHSEFGGNTFEFDSNNGTIDPRRIGLDLDGNQVTLRVNVLLSSFFGRH